MHLFWTMDQFLFFVCLKFIRSVSTGMLTSRGKCACVVSELYSVIKKNRAKNHGCIKKE